MPQSSIHYAAARISVLSKNALDTGRLERLIAAKTLGEAEQALSEIGWSQIDNQNYEQLASGHVKKACALIRSISPAQEVTDCFMLSYDIQNLKLLLKARSIGEPVDTLSDCGILSADMLAHAVTDHQYQRLPLRLADAMNTLEKRIAISVDPLEIDLVLDKAFYEMVFETLGKSKNKGAKAYFLMKADITNAITLLRVKNIGRNIGFLKTALLPFGTIPYGEWEKAFDQPEKIPTLLMAYGKKVVEAAKNAMISFKALPALEKAMDDRLLAIYKEHKHDPFRIETLVGYIISCQREASAVRLIMAGKANGFPSELIRERMRELYG